MALLDPVDGLNATEFRSEAPTKHPGVCLAGGFAFLVGTALLVHLIFTALI